MNTDAFILLNGHSKNQPDTHVPVNTLPRRSYAMVITATKPALSSDAEGALAQLVEVTQKGMGQVNDLILERADSHVEMVPELARYLIDSGGKRLRPMLTIAAAQLFGGVNENAVRFAAAVEFMHTATLLHDDVVDESDMRRGKPAARKVWGNQASVLVGDFLLGQAFMMMVESGDLEALGVLANAAAVIAEGEVFQLSKALDLAATPQDYDQVIRGKTAALFEAAMDVGAKAGGADTEKRAAVARYGLELGRAFQLVDDALDYGGADGTLGKNTGDDLREGKMTLPVILSLKAADADEKKVITSALGNVDAKPDDVERVVSIMGKYDVLSATITEAENAVKSACDALAPLPQGPINDLLAGTAHYCLKRVY